MAGELAAKQLAPIFFFEADFSGGFARAWTGYGSIVWDAKTWLGTGQFLGFSQIDESREIQATSLSVSLSGVDPVMVATAYGDFSQGRPLKAWLGVLDVATAQVVSDPVAIFAGRMDTISDQDDGAQAVITITAESNLADLKRLRARFYTDQDQQRVFSGDRSFRYLPSLQDRPVYWGVREGSPQLPSTSV
jgi:hypothetical protein